MTKKNWRKPVGDLVNRSPYIPFEDWFWSGVDSSSEDGCWPWTRGVGKAGYGVVRYQWVQYKTHRVAWNLTYGEIPSGLQVRHTCDNPVCCRPDHLLVGTAQDNADDRVSRGRSARLYGTNNPNGHISTETVEHIKALRADGLVFREIEKITGVHRGTAAEICRGVLRVKG